MIIRFLFSALAFIGMAAQLGRLRIHLPRRRALHGLDLRAAGAPRPTRTLLVEDRGSESGGEQANGLRRQVQGTAWEVRLMMCSRSAAVRVPCARPALAVAAASGESKGERR